MNQNQIDELLQIAGEAHKAKMALLANADQKALIDRATLEKLATQQAPYEFFHDCTGTNNGIGKITAPQKI